MKILVTGGAGFIGSHIVEKLVEQQHEVIVVDTLLTGKEEFIHPKAFFYKVNITAKELEEVFAIERPNAVIHQAAQIDVQRSLREPWYDAQVNILGTINLLECCRKYHVEKIIYASSAAVYGDPQYLPLDEQHAINPMSFYGISKHTPEHYIQAYARLYGLKYTILRYANVYGPRQDPKGEGGVISIFIDNLLRDERPVIYGDGEQTRDFVYVSDVAAANVAALTLGDDEIINISCNQQTSINELFSMLTSIMGKEMEPIYREPRPGDILHSYLDNSKALLKLNWKPRYTLRDGLQATVQYYQERYAGLKK
ncbi:SDR family oxidoreductase [Bacillaceae bacterium]